MTSWQVDYTSNKRRIGQLESDEDLKRSASLKVGMVGGKIWLNCYAVGELEYTSENNFLLLSLARAFLWKLSQIQPFHNPDLFSSKQLSEARKLFEKLQ